MSTPKEKIKVGITIGDVNGIGPEVIIKTFLAPQILHICTPVIYASSKVISYHRKTLDLNDFNYNLVKSINEINSKKINVINCWDEEIKIDLGVPTDTSGKYAIKSLEAAVIDLAKHKIDTLVTAPLNKDMVRKAGFIFPGHTEYLAEKFDSKKYLMFMVSENLRVGVVSGHVSLDQVTSDISTDKIANKIRLINHSLIQDFRIRKPRIAVLGLNPHAGDNGLLGNEEQEIIAPAIKTTYEENILAFGPYSADGFFGSAAYSKFDGILAMYHDQGLIPFKALSFNSGVNFTAGLPVVRTSPDHGTAYEIAGKNEASEASFRQAIYLACDIVRTRNEYTELTANLLSPGTTSMGEDL